MLRRGGQSPLVPSLNACARSFLALMSAERFEVELTQGAEDDLEAIYDYLAEKRSVDSAQALLQHCSRGLILSSSYRTAATCPRSWNPWVSGNSGKFCLHPTD
jgi:toxin ParE1/3/4